MAGEEVLLEAECRLCEITFDVWARRGADADRGRVFVEDLSRLRCPECLVVSDQIKEKEKLS